MRLTTIKNNMSVIETGKWHIMFSYNRPVASWNAVDGYYRTSEKFSKTTSRHITQWIGKETPSKIMPQNWFEGLASGETT